MIALSGKTDSSYYEESFLYQMISRLRSVRDVVSNVHRGHNGEAEGSKNGFGDGEGLVKVTTRFNKIRSQCNHTTSGSIYGDV